MIIGGLQKFSLLDYPGKISAIIFTRGCNFRCQFCYNPMLVWPEAKVGKIKNISPKKGEEKGHALITKDDLFRFLKKRTGKLEGVVITGGEPTLQKDLPKFIKNIKRLGFLVKLDTNGTNPKMLKKVIKEKLVDYIAMDIKGPKEKYEKITGIKTDFKNIKKSVKMIMKSKLPYEFRTTLVPGLLSKDDIKKTGEFIQGADKWYLQKFQSNKDLVNKKFEKTKPFTAKEMEEMRKTGKKYVKKCSLR